MYAETFCPECRKNTPFYVRGRKEDASVRGVDFSYIRYVAYCSVCGKEVYVPSINDMMVESRYEAYKKEKENNRLKELVKEAHGCDECLHRHGFGANEGCIKGHYNVWNSNAGKTCGDWELSDDP